MRHRASPFCADTGSRFTPRWSHTVCVLLLFFLVSFPAVASTTDAAIDSGAAWLVSQQNANGSWGVSDSLKPVYTAKAVQALRSAGTQQAAYLKGVAWLENHHQVNVDFTARKVSALAGRNTSVGSYVAQLFGEQDSDGAVRVGWGLSGVYESAPLDTMLALDALAIAGSTADPDVIKGVEFLLSSQAPDGSWAYTSDGNASAGATGLAVTALSHYGGVAGVAQAITDATVYLAAQVSGMPTDYERSIALRALALVGQQAAARDTLVSGLETGQAAGGSWSQDVLTTAEAVEALSTQAGRTTVAQLARRIFPDAYLHREVALALGNNAQDALTRRELLTIKSLDLTEQFIRDLSGLGELTNLEDLNLTRNSFSSLEPLRTLTSLKRLNLTGHQGVLVTGSILDLSPLLSLTQLEYLSLKDMGVITNRKNRLRDLLSNPLLSGLLEIELSHWDVWPYYDDVSYFDDDGDGAVDFIETWMHTNPFLATSKPTFVAQPYGQWATADLANDPLGIKALLDQYASPYTDLADGWHPLFEDFDGDGDLDVAVYVHGRDEQVESLTCSGDCGGSYIGPYSGPLVIYENVSGTYVQRQTFWGFGDVGGMTAFDLENDGDRDLLFFGMGVAGIFRADLPSVDGTLTFFPANGDLGLDVFPQSGYGLHADHPLVFDINSDGYLDMVFVYGEKIIKAIYDPALGEYIESEVVVGPATLRWIPKTAGATDIDGDGRVDIVVQGYEFIAPPAPVTLYALVSTGNGDFTAYTSQPGLLPDFTQEDYIVEQVSFAHLDESVDGFQRPEMVQFETALTTARFARDAHGQLIADYEGGRIRIFNNLRIEQGQLMVDVGPIIHRSGHDTEVSYGGGLVDVDNDGYQDILLSMNQSAELYLSHEGTLFNRHASVSGESEMWTAGNKRPYGLDWTGNGFLDLILPFGLYDSTGYLHLNEFADDYSGRNFVEVELVGRGTGGGGYATNRDAIGAKAVLYCDDSNTQRRMVRELTAAWGSNKVLHFGVPQGYTCSTLLVDWPSDDPPTFIFNVTLNQRITVNQ